MIQYTYLDNANTPSLYQQSYLYLNPTGPTGCPSYTNSITPYSAASSVYVNYKVKYQTNDQANTLLNLYVYRQRVGIDASYTYLFGDTNLGQGSGVALSTNTYNTNYIDTPGTTNQVNYQLWMQTTGQSTGTPSINGAGILGCTGNCLLLEELNGTGVAGAGQYNLALPNTWTGTNTFTKDILVSTITVGVGLGNDNSNTAVGFSALSSNGGGNNTAVGYNSLKANTTGGTCVAVGYQSLLRNTTGQSNVGLGSSAGFNITTTSFNTVVGYNSYITGSYTQSTSIGAFSQPSASNQIVLGTSTETLFIQGGLNYKVGTSVTSTPTTLSTPLSQFYTINASAATTIYLPVPSSTYTGAVVIFRRLVGSSTTNAVTFSITGTPTNMISYSAVAASTSSTLASGQYSTQFICDGTNWYQTMTQ
jgi:hypothetical protein